MCWITFFCTHRFNLAYGFVTFARFARLFFLNDSSRKLLLISDAKINNGSWSSDCFFSDSCLGLHSYTPTDAISPTASLPLLASLACFFNDSSRMLLLLSDACIYNGSLSSDCFFSDLLSRITFLYTHRFNLAYGFVTFARFARLFFFNDSSRKLLLISGACINNGSLSSDCFFLTLVLDYVLIHPQIQSRLRLRYLCSLRSPVFFK